MKLFCIVVALFLISGVEMKSREDNDASYDYTYDEEIPKSSPKKSSKSLRVEKDSDEEPDIRDRMRKMPEEKDYDYKDDKEVDYCTLLPCGKNHVACKENNLKPAKDCPKDSEYYDMEDLKDFIVKFHNRKRNDVAGGSVKRLKAAARMATMQWDHELHVTATAKAKLCSMLPDACHGTKRFKYSGQNYAMYGYGGDIDRLSLEYIVENRLEHWYNSSANCTRRVVKSFPDPKLNQTNVGLFTIMVREGNTHVGCGLNRYEVDGFYKVIFICHYATNNFIGSPTYKVADEPGVECKTGINPKYPNLCSPMEKYKYNSY